MSEILLRVAAKAVIVNNEGKLLIVREAKTYSDGTAIGRYMFPGGRLDSGEDFLDGLKREAREETGLEVDPLYPVYIGEWRPIIEGVPNHIIAIYMVCKRVGGEIKLSLEHDDFAWINTNEISKYDIVETDQKVIEAYSKAPNR